MPLHLLVVVALDCCGTSILHDFCHEHNKAPTAGQSKFLIFKWPESVQVFFESFDARLDANTEWYKKYMLVEPVLIFTLCHLS